MATLFGVPLFGTLFVPLAVGVVTFFLFWTFVLSKKNLQSSVQSDEPQALNVSEDSSVLKPKGNTKEKKTKNCGSNGGCCSKKDGKSGGCSSTNKAIGTAKLFVDSTLICQKFASVLSTQLTASLTVEQISVSEMEEIDLTDHADGSLCVFLTDTSEQHEKIHWIKMAISDLSNGDKPLTGMKYSVFTILSENYEKSKFDTTDQLLHKSGAVRVCRAESADISAAVFSNVFDDWAEELLAQVHRWNSPKKKACKCGPTKRTNETDGFCSSSSSKCSDSGDEEKKHISSAAPVPDLEDIVNLL